jgi:5-methylcytosine-specific restriction endonuclease McrA
VRPRAEHRIAPRAGHPGGREIGGVWYSLCRGCGEPVRKSDGSPDRRRRWHAVCAHDYLLTRDPMYVRYVVWRRDRGLCASCGRDCNPRPDYEARRHAVTGNWEADHVQPLIAGGGFDLSNLQTLCTACHRSKTAFENSTRHPRTSRWRSAAEAGQLALPDVLG